MAKIAMSSEPVTILENGNSQSLPSVVFEKTSQEEIIKKILEMRERKDLIEEFLTVNQDAIKAQKLAGHSVDTNLLTELRAKEVEFATLRNFLKAITYVR